MDVRIVKRWDSKLPEGDAHPYRTGAWKPNVVEYDATDLEVIEGEVPKDLDGVYLRNTENPLFEAIGGRYHPFDGDGMLHSVRFANGRADYRNRFVRTAGLAAEVEAGRALWAGILEDPATSERDGWGARRRMKDASSTAVAVHAGKAITSFYQCGDLYELDPVTLETHGAARWGGRFPTEIGVSAHTKVDERTGELLFFNYGKDAPFMHYGVLDASGALTHYQPVALPGPRLPHDMAFSERFVIVNDFPLFWDPALLAKNVHRARLYPDLPSRFGVIPRAGGDVRWFEAAPTYVLHFVNAWEEGDELVLDGYFQECPEQKRRGDEPPWGPFMRSLDMNEMRARLHRWRFNLASGATREEDLDDAFTEFPTLHAGIAGRRHRYTYAMTGEPGWFLFNGLVRTDMQTGKKQEWRFPKGVYASESPVAPRSGARVEDEDDAYVVTFVSDMNADASECQIFHASQIDKGPICRLRLPERISSGTHACWGPASALTSR